MHLRRLTLVAFAAPVLFAACSSDNNPDNGVDVPAYVGTPDQNTDPLQPAPDTTPDNTPDNTPVNAGGSGSTEGPPDIDTPIQPGENPDTSNGNAGAGGSGAGGSGQVEPDPVDPGDFIPVGDVENRGADCQVPALPAGNTLPNNPNLPDPFTRLDGTRITQKSDWVCRREEILRQTFQYIYGQKPPKPDSVTGTVTNTLITVNITHQGRNETFTAAVTLPAGQGPFPAIIAFGNGGVRQVATGMGGIASINFQQGNVGSRNTGVFSRLYPQNTAGDLAAWAWGVSRVIDVLQTTGNIDTTRLAVTGCSFMGKAAFAAGALDERIALTIPLESGIGGVAAYKIVPVLEPPDPNGNPTEQPEQPQHAINSGWLPQGSLVAQFQRLPVDTHEILGLVAPRGLLVLGNTGGNGEFYKNLDFRSEHATALAGREIFTALGVPTNISYDSRNVSHCGNTDMFTAAVQASVGRFLLGNNATTGAFTTDWEGVRAEPDQFIDWTTPTLEGELP